MDDGEKVGRGWERDVAGEVVVIYGGEEKVHDQEKRDKPTTQTTVLLSAAENPKSTRSYVVFHFISLVSPNTQAGVAV